MSIGQGRLCCRQLGFLGVFLVLVTLVTTALAQPLLPFPQHQQYAADSLKPSRWSQAQQDRHVLEFYRQWKADYLVAVDTDDGVPQYRVSFGSQNPGRTVSEGQGYGMLIVVLMAGADPEARLLFDGLWRFARAWPSDIDSRLMGWQIPIDEDDGNASAFDGDADIAYALLLASRQWPEGGYLTAAKEVLDGQLASAVGPDSDLPTFGDWVEPDGEEYDQWGTRTSDFMPAHFRAFAAMADEPRWLDVRDRVLDVALALQQEEAPRSGLLPDFAVVDQDGQVYASPPNYLETSYDGHYFFNAGRDPWRLGTEALLNAEPRAKQLAAGIADGMRRITDADPAQMQSGYLLSGLPIPYETENSTFFMAPVGVGAMLLEDGQHWLDDLYEAVYRRHQDYYEDSVTLLCLLVMTGNYWDPVTATQ